MAETFRNLSFGEAVFKFRKERAWTVRDFIDQLGAKGQKTVSPAYITRIEQYGEIPSPDLILRIADVFQVDGNELLECAKKLKVRKFNKALEEKYQRALALYRTQKKRT